MKNKGITLIALIITIIVMLILVAVTINMAINGGLFGYAGNSARDTKIAMEDENKIGDGKIEVDGKRYDSPEDFINGEESRTWYSNDLLGENGVLTENSFYKDSNKEIVEIPKGFGIVDDYNVINQGLVISDKFDSNGNSIGNEFVWIPVVYTKNNRDSNNNGLDDGFEAAFYRCEYSNNARSGNYSISSTTQYKEPYPSASQWETTEYNNMMLSVQEHKGFYIGRYETGEKENNKIVVQRDKKPYTNIKWGESMTNYGTKGMVYLSRNMYTGDNYNVKSTLCYGVQWDAMLDFIKDETHNINSSSDWGNYKNTNADIWKITRTTAKYYKNDQWNDISGELTKETAGNVKLTTGANDNFKAKNVYDVAGNVNEWTMESITSGGNTSARIYRAGCYDVNGNGAQVRGWSNPINESGSVGFRVALYIST